MMVVKEERFLRWVISPGLLEERRKKLFQEGYRRVGWVTDYTSGHYRSLLDDVMSDERLRTGKPVEFVVIPAFYNDAVGGELIYDLYAKEIK